MHATNFDFFSFSRQVVHESPLTASAALEASAEPSIKNVTNNVPKPAPGTCVVCLTDDVQVLGAEWLHQQGQQPRQQEESSLVALTEAHQVAVDNPGGIIGEEKSDSCPVSACLPCLKTYFEVIKNNKHCCWCVGNLIWGEVRVMESCLRN